MFKNDIFLIFRHLLKRKFISLVSVLGLAIGIATVMLIGIYIQDELSYDRFHENEDRIYRLTTFQKDDSVERVRQRSNWWMGPILFGDNPQIDYVRFFSFNNRVFQHQNNAFYGSGFCADANVFKIFTFPLIKGDPNVALEKPFSVVITESFAQKLFGNKDPINQVVSATENGTNLLSGTHLLTVTGVLKNIPNNSHLKFDFLISLNTITAINPTYFRSREWMILPTYVLLSDRYSIEDFDAQERSLVRKFYNNRGAVRNRFALQPLVDIHLDPYIDRQLFVDTNRSPSLYIYIFSVVAFFILITACVNTFSLNLARSLERAKEIGVKKVVGARRWELAKQFLIESILISAVAVLIAFLMVYLCLPYLNALSQKKLIFTTEQIPIYGVLLFLGALLVGIGVGGWPAIFLSRFRPVDVLKGRFGQRATGPLQKVFFVFQFSVSTLLLICSVFVHSQTQYLSNKKLGFSPDQVLYVGTHFLSPSQRNVLKQQLKNSPFVLNATTSSYELPSTSLRTSTVRGELIKGRHSLFYFRADEDFLKTMDIKLKDGRNFSVLRPDQTACLLNETATKLIGLQAPIGKSIVFNGKNKIVVGVVEDFNFMSLHNKIEPLCIEYSPEEKPGGVMSVKLSSQNIEEGLNWIHQKWNDVVPDVPFPANSRFVSDKIERLYRNERVLKELISIFSCLALILSGMGMLGFVVLLLEQKAKEIGIRKVLGASESGIIVMYLRQFVGLGLGASFAVWPVVYYVINKWLQEFEYRIQIRFDVFFYVTLFTVFFIVLIVGTQTYRVVVMNPIHSLRDE